METSSPSSKKTTHNPAYTPPPPPPPPPPALLPPVAEVAAKDTDVATSSSAAVGGGLEDDKDRIVVEIMQMYSRQQEKLNSTLHKQLQLEMVSQKAQAKLGGRRAFTFRWRQGQRSKQTNTQNVTQDVLAFSSN